MRSSKGRLLVPILACALVCTTGVSAFTLIQMSVEDLTQRAETIVRGMVVDAVEGTVEAGGGAIPFIHYRVKVTELFKGTPDIVKEDVAIVEIRMVGRLKKTSAEGDIQAVSLFRDMPKLQVGHEYLLFRSQASAIGLSTTVGLGQGAFKLFSKNKEEFAVNEFDNAGLGLPSDGPVLYSELAEKVRTILAGS